ncbi:MAG TPA: PQQ-binding-like beta-propeller repeat protein [Vicinamibacterales bacterium]|nr:PQQ-binding-like beta-propeller repeat protein [Vicinamibacterales bacterium]
MLRERTTVSSACSAFLVAALLAAPARVAAFADPLQIFPSELAWTIDVSTRPIAPPVSYDNRLFVALQTGIAAVSLKDRAVVWTQKLVAAGAMAAAANRLIVPSDGQLHALDAGTGQTAWTAKTGPLTAPPFIHGDWVYVASGEQLSAYNIADGAAGWSRDLGVVEERPTVMDKRLYVPVSDGRIVALELATGEQLWETAVIGIKPTEPLVYGDRVFAGSAAKRFCSFRSDNGAKDWCYPIGAVIVGQPAADASHVYFVALDNLLYALNRSHGARLWKKDLRYRPSAGPFLVGASISAPGTTSKMQVFDAATGNKGAELTLPAELAMVPALVLPSDQGPMQMASLVGDLKNLWKLAVSVPPPPALPDLKVTPLSELPGRAVPLSGSRAPRE